jgi:L-lysine 2,3-aminomutase
LTAELSTRVLQIRPNSDCRHHCAYCARAGSGGGNMTLDDIAANLDFFRRTRRIDEVVISGGEMTAREDFLEILTLLRPEHFKLVTVISSGQARRHAAIGEMSSTARGSWRGSVPSRTRSS